MVYKPYTNGAESFFSRMRRAEIGHHHHIAGIYLVRYAQEMAWREDHRRVSNGQQVMALVDADYFHPLERLYRERRSTTATSIHEIQSFISDSATSLMSFSYTEKGVAEQIQAFCVALHQQLIDDLMTEAQIVVHDGDINQGETGL